MVSLDQFLGAARSVVRSESSNASDVPNALKDEQAKTVARKKVKSVEAASINKIFKDAKNKLSGLIDHV